MDEPSTKDDSVGSLWTAAFAVALSAGALHTALSLGSAPRALGSFGALMAANAAATLVFGLVALVALGSLPGILTRITGPCCSRSVQRAALGAAIVVGAALWPLNGGANASSGSLVQWLATSALAGGSVFAVAAAGGGRLRALAQLGVPLASLALLGASWARTYSSGVLAIGLALAAVLFLVVAWKGLDALPPLPILFALGGAVVASGAGGVLRGDGTLRQPRPRTFDDARPSPVILITVDTLRPDFLSRAREDGAETPTLDALFADSVVFDAARASAPWTKPSVATILTGLSPLVHGTTSRRVRLPEEAHTLAEHLVDAGYTTAGMGLNVHLEPFFGFAQGFDQYWFPVREDWGDSLGPEVLRQLDADRFPALFPTTEALADVAVDWLDANADRDFFLWIHFLDPHWPYEPPAEHLPPREEGQRIGARWGEHETVTQVQAGIHKLGEADRDRVRALYRGEIEYVDAELARVFAKLRELGLYDQALIAFTSDHGEEFWEHGTFEHGHTLYDEVLRIPLAFKLPGATARDRVATDVWNEALTPTLLDLAGVAPKHPFTAMSLRRFWDEESSEGDRAPQDGLAAGTYYYDEKRMLLTDGMKLIVDYGTGGLELFDLTEDPGERMPFGPHDPRAKGLLERLDARAKELGDLRGELGIQNEAAVADDATQRMMQGLGYN